MPTPVEIGGVADPVLRITWSDGHRSTYTWRMLRLHCPCAACRGEWRTRRDVDPQAIPEHIRAMRLDRVGAYALRFTWSDGHSTGIYPFPLLRSELCECDECRLGRAPGGAP